MSDIAIKFENISKQYRLGTIGTGTLSHDLKRWWTVNVQGKEDPYLKIGSVNDRSTKADSEYVWALRDIDFEVKQGEVLGIIGKNGAGKSTLLKILSRVTSPTTGQILAKGRIASLLEVGTGFHPEMTGYENIFMNGSIMGMSKSEIIRKMDEIVDFSGVERYIDTPVKRYSSGMTVRLGFAIAAHLEPEILVVDEVLAVGDAEFQKKAIGKIQDVSHNDGRTVLFVSHNMGAINTLCSRGILLEKGIIKNHGNITNIIDQYISEGNNENSYIGSDSFKDIYFKKISFKDHLNRPTNNFAFNKGIQIFYEIGVKEIFSNSTLSFQVLNSRLVPVFTNHYIIKQGDRNIIAHIPASLLLPGKYYLRSGLHIPNIQFLDFPENTLSFFIEDTGNDHSAYTNVDQGFICANVKWESINNIVLGEHSEK